MNGAPIRRLGSGAFRTVINSADPRTNPDREMEKDRKCVVCKKGFKILAYGSDHALNFVSCASCCEMEVREQARVGLRKRVKVSGLPEALLAQIASLRKEVVYWKREAAKARQAARERTA